MDFEKNSHEILDALDRPILVIDSNFVIVAANKAAYRSFCLSPCDLIGRECFRVTHRSESPCWQNNQNCPVKLSFELREKIKVIHKHNYAGREVIEEINAVPMFNEKGEIIYIIEELNDISELIQTKEIVDHLKNEINTLRGILPICSSCKKIRNDEGYWQQIESYIHEHSDTQFTHGICPDCAKKLYPDYFNK